MSAKLIVGLGNPGPKYERSRHNAGFMVVDRLAQQLNLKFEKNKFNGEAAKGTFKGQDFFVLKPLTFMNESGVCVRPFMTYHNISIEDVIIVYDDMDTELGSIRIREFGSSGGQNGMLSVSNHLNSQEIKRIRVGIGRPQRTYSEDFVVDYVLNPFTPAELAVFIKAVDGAVSALLDFLVHPFGVVMSAHNKKVA